MRSLYTEDIQGARPKLTIFDKSYHFKQHEEDLKRNSIKHQRNKQYEWYVPVEKSNKTETEPYPYRNTIKLISQHTGISRQIHYQSLKKRNDNNKPQQRLRNYSILSNSGFSSLNKSKITVNEGNNPYYPHRIREVNDQSFSNRFTGNRSWNYTPNAQIHLPNPQSQYISKWIKL